MHLHRPQNQKNHWFYKALGTFSDFFSILDLSWLILAQHGLQDAFKTPPRPPKTTPRRLQEPPRASKMPPRRSRGRPKSLSSHCFFNGFAFLGLLGAILVQHGFLDASKSFQDVSKSIQDASQNFQDAFRSSKDAAKSLQDAAQTSPRDAKKIYFSLAFSLVSHSWAFLALSWLNMATHPMISCNTRFQIHSRQRHQSRQSRTTVNGPPTGPPWWRGSPKT